jgi:hypothetical protein
MRIYNKWYKELWWWIVEHKEEVFYFVAGIVTAVVVGFLWLK